MLVVAIDLNRHMSVDTSWIISVRLRAGTRDACEKSVGLHV
jgi:hypothetical protein